MRYRTDHRAIYALRPLAAALLIAAGTAARAETALEEVLVTAERHEKSLQDTPISVVAVDAAKIEKLGIATIADLASTVPNLKIMSFGVSATTLRFFIRGVGPVDSQITLDSPVGIYLDGVYMSRSVGMAIDVADLERVEVLRGPQGTLYGRNTTGGAINLITRRPTMEPGFSQLLSVGEYGLLKSRSSLNFAVGEDFAAKVTYQKHQRDGWIENEGSGGDFHEYDRDSGRVDLRWTPADNVTVDYSHDYSKNDFVGNYYHLSEVSAGFAGFLPEQPDRVDEARLPDKYEDSWAKASGHNLTVAVDTGIGTFKSITAYRQVEEDVYQDFSGNPILEIFKNNRFTAEQDQFSQELQLVGASSDDRIDYIAGIYYLEEDGHEVARDEVTLVNFPLPRDISADNTTWAVYAQGGWRPTADSPWKLTLGLRYTEDKRKGDNTFESGTETFENLNPSVTVMYDISDSSSVYAKVVSGYKAGGFNMRQANFSASYDEETLVSYEVGWKTELMDRRVRWNGALFFSDYDDMQLDILVPNQPNPTLTQTQNAGTAEISGLETELTALLGERTQLTLSYGYLDSEIKKVEGDDANLYHLPNAPKHMVSASFDWDIASLPLGELRFSADWNWQDDSVTGVRELVGISVDAYDVAGARLSLEGSDWFGKGNYTVAAWIRNAFDEEYPVDTFGSFNGLHANRVTAYAEPRTVGVDFEYRY